MSDLKSYQPLMEKCSHCAFCQATCPVYGADLLETHMPRARMEIVRACLVDGDLEKSRRAREIIDRCLLCGNCTRTCPAGVPVEEITAAARAELHKGKKKSLVQRHVLKKFMKKRGFTGLYKKAAVWAKKKGMAPAELPDPASRRFAKKYAGNWPADGTPRATAAYYIGCATNSLYPDTADAVVKVLTKNGIQVNIPGGLYCCGIPAYADGDADLALECVRNNIEILAEMDADVIVTDCTTCGSFFREKAAKLLPPDDPLLEKAQAVAAKTVEVTDYLVQMGLTNTPDPLDLAVTYHVPCHRSWTPGLNDAPRRLLEQIPGVTLKEMEDPEACCGAGGSFFSEHRELSEKIRKDKFDNIDRTGTSNVITQCPACRTWIGAPDSGYRVLHPITVLARAYAGDEEIRELPEPESTVSNQADPEEPTT